MITVSLPPALDTTEVERAIAGRADVRLVTWDLVAEPEGVDPAEIDMIVSPFHTLSATPNPSYVGIDALARALPRASRAQLVQLLSLGSEGVQACVPEGVLLANAAGAMEHQTAELACALLLAVSRGIPEFSRLQTWANSRTPGLWGKRVVVLGQGGVGREVVRRLEPFHAEIVRVARSGRTLPDGAVVHPVSELTELARDADALVCAVPLQPETTGIVDADVLAALRDGAIVVNVGRGPVVRTDALLDEVTTGRLSAALDVTDPEPLPDGHPFWELPNVIITPHVGGNSDAMRPLLHALVADQIVRVARGERPVNVLNPSATDRSRSSHQERTEGEIT